MGRNPRLRGGGCHGQLELGTRDPTDAAEPHGHMCRCLLNQWDNWENQKAFCPVKAQTRGWLLHSLLVQLLSVSFVIAGWGEMQCAVFHTGLFLCYLVCCHQKAPPGVTAAAQESCLWLGEQSGGGSWGGNLILRGNDAVSCCPLCRATVWSWNVNSDCQRDALPGTEPWHWVNVCYLVCCIMCHATISHRRPGYKFPGLCGFL